MFQGIHVLHWTRDLQMTGKAVIVLWRIEYKAKESQSNRPWTELIIYELFNY